MFLANPLYFGFGKQCIKILSDNSDYLHDIASILEPFRLPYPARETTTFQVVIHSDDGKAEGPPYVILKDGKEVFATADSLRAVFRLEYFIVCLLVKDANFLHFHSGTVEKDGHAILLPAQADSGKTSLTVALSQNGFTSFSDEVGLIDPTSLHLHPFPRNIYVEPEMKELFHSLGYRLKFRKLKWKQMKGDNLWCDLKKINWGGKEKTSRVSLILFPKYSPAYKNRVKPVSPANAFIRLIENGTKLNEFQDKDLDIIEKLVKETECYELETGQLGEAVEVVKNLFEEVVARKQDA